MQLAIPRYITFQWWRCWGNGVRSLMEFSDKGGSTKVQQVMSDVLHDWPLSPFARHWWWVMLDIVFSPPCPSVMRSAAGHELWPPGHWWFRLTSKLALLLVVASYEFRSAYISAPLNSKLFLRHWKHYNQHKWRINLYNHASCQFKTDVSLMKKIVQGRQKTLCFAYHRSHRVVRGL